MKNLISRLSLLFVLVPCCIHAQTPRSDRKATHILKELSQKYRKLHTIEAHFSFMLNNAQDHMNETQSGVLVVEPGDNKYHLQLSGHEVFSDGKLTYTYLKDQKEVQITAADTSNQRLNPARIFSLYETGFSSTYLKESHQGKQKLDLIELIPLQSKTIAKAQLSVARHPRGIYQIQSTDKNGNQTTITVNSFKANPHVSADLFTFNKKNYPGVEVVDLR